jgi:hypothetical protein
MHIAEIEHSPWLVSDVAEAYGQAQRAYGEQANKSAIEQVDSQVLVQADRIELLVE